MCPFVSPQNPGPALQASLLLGGSQRVGRDGDGSGRFRTEWTGCCFPVKELPGPLTRTLNSFYRLVIQGRVTSHCPWEAPPLPKVPCPAHCDRVPFTIWGWLQIKVLEDQPHGKPLWSLDISAALLAFEIRLWVSGGRYLLWSLVGQEYRGLCRTSMEDSPKE